MRAQWFAVLLLVLVGTSVITVELMTSFHNLYPHLAEILSKVLLTLLVLVFVHLLHSVFFTSELMEMTQRELDEKLKNFATELSVISKKTSDSLLREAVDSHKASLRTAIDSVEILVPAARRCGLIGVYENRSEALPDVIKAIETAKKKVLVQAVALMSDLTWDGLTKALAHRNLDEKNGGIVFRLLLLKGIGRAALLRSIVEADRGRLLPLSIEPEKIFFDTTLYRRFQGGLIDMKYGGRRHLRRKTRFYGQDPNSWMVIVDDSVFVEHYTFGRHPDDVVPREDADQLGGKLPVLHYRREVTEADPARASIAGPYQVYLDHFWKVWLIADVDPLHMDPRIANRSVVLDSMLDDTLRQRTKSICRALATLSYQNNDVNAPHVTPIDRRRSPRKPCKSHVIMSVVCVSGDQHVTLECRLVDFSYHGISVKPTNCETDVMATLVDKLSSAGGGEPDLILCEIENVRIEATSPQDEKASELLRDILLVSSRVALDVRERRTYKIVQVTDGVIGIDIRREKESVLSSVMFEPEPV